MYSTLKRVAVLSALGATLGVVAPVAGASAAGTPVAPATLQAFPGVAGTGFAPGAFSFGGPVFSGQAFGDTVSGAIIITTAPTSFINTNNQISGVGNFTGGQVAP